MAYQYYQSAYPGWGTAPMQFGAPLQPTFQPLPSWNGWDYYNAHAINPDRSIWQSIRDRLRGVVGSGGMSFRQAESWHNRIYSGLVPLVQVLPTDIGAAAAYEAYRMWRHHHSVLLSPLGGLREREREALTGLAVAEASRLWQYSGRPMDTYGLRAALESAALTASRISYRVMEDDRDEIMSRRSNDLDDRDSDYRSHYHHHHHRSSLDDNNEASLIVTGGAPPMSYGTPFTSTMPFSGGVGTAVSYGGAPGVYGEPQNFIPGTMGTIPGVYPAYNTMTAPYSTIPGTYGQPAYAMPYTSGGLLANPYGAVTTAGGYATSYGGAPVVGGVYTSPYGNVYSGQSMAPSLIIQPQSGRRHHRHHSR